MWLLLNASKYVSIPIISEWLRLEELIDLDSALCNHRSRKVYHSLLQEFPHVVDNKLESVAICPSAVWLLWIKSRGFGSGTTKARFRNKTVEEFNFMSEVQSDFLAGLKTFEVDRLTQQNEETFVRMMSFCRNLDSVTITNSLFINNLLPALKVCGSQLTTLCLKGCYQLLDPVAEILLRECRNVTDLDMSNCYQITSRVMKCMAVHCRQIQRFNLQAFSMVNVTRDTQTLIHHNFCYGGLTHFVMSRVNNPIIKSLIWFTGSSLLELDYANSYYLNMDAINDVPRCCTRVTKINTSYCYTLPDYCVGNLSDIPTLTSLDAKDMHQLTSDSITKLALRSPVSSNGATFSALAELILFGSRKVNQECLVLLAQHCSHTLTSLVLTAMQLTNDTALAICTSLSSAGRIRRLGLSSNPLLTNETLIQCIELCGRSLAVLELSMMGNLSYTVVKSVGQNCCGLRSIELGNNPELTDAGMLQLCKYCRDLSHISVNQNPLITNSTLLFILRLLKRSITSLNVINCHDITYEQLTSFIQAAPRIRTVKTGLTRTNNFKMFTDVFVVDT